VFQEIQMLYWTYYQFAWFRHIYTSNLRGFCFGSIYGGSNLHIKLTPYWQMDSTFSCQSKSYLWFPYYQPCIHKNCRPLPISTIGVDAFGLTGHDWSVCWILECFVRVHCNDHRTYISRTLWQRFAVPFWVGTSNSTSKFGHWFRKGIVLWAAITNELHTCSTHLN